MRIRTLLVPACLAGAALLALSAGGCSPFALYYAPRMARAQGRTYLTVQSMHLGDEEDRFLVLTSVAPHTGQWTSPVELRGRVAGLAPAGRGVEVVFGNGAVFAFRYAEGRLQRERVLAAGPELLVAARVGADLLAVEAEGRELRLHRLERGAEADEPSWHEHGPVLHAPGGAEAAALTHLHGRPVVIWQPAGAGRDAALAPDAPGLRAALLGPDGWQTLPAPPAAMQAGAFAATAGEGAFTLVGLARAQGVWSQADRAIVLRYTDEAWTRAHTPDLRAWAPGPLGPGLAAIRDEAGLLVALSGAQGVRLLAPGDGAGLALTDPVPGLEVTQRPDAALLLWVIAVGLAVLAVAHAFRRRWRVGRALPGARGMPPRVGRRAVAPAAGGVASPVERVTAFALDTVLLLPLVLGYLYARHRSLEAVFASPRGLEELLVAGYLYPLAFILYATLGEALHGQTVGKYALGIAVRAVEGGRPGYMRVLLRNLLRTVDQLFMPVGGGVVLPFFPAIVSMLFSRVNQRVGDRVGGTLVVRRVPVGWRRLVLASASPRRRELLRGMGLSFVAVAPEVDERPPSKARPDEAALALARRKLETVGGRLSGQEVVLAADTLVALEDEILGKPQDREAARDMLRRLSGTRHRVVTAVAVWDRATDRRLAVVDAAVVQMRAMSEAEIDAYVDSGEAEGKAGSYAIQETGDRFARVVRGDLSTVIGLPLAPVRALLDELEW